MLAALSFTGELVAISPSPAHVAGRTGVPISVILASGLSQSKRKKHDGRFLSSDEK